MKRIAATIWADVLGEVEVKRLERLLVVMFYDAIKEHKCAADFVPPGVIEVRVEVTPLDTNPESS